MSISRWSGARRPLASGCAHRSSGHRRPDHRGRVGERGRHPAHPAGPRRVHQGRRPVRRPGVHGGPAPGALMGAARRAAGQPARCHPRRAACHLAGRFRGRLRAATVAARRQLPGRLARSRVVAVHPRLRRPRRRGAQRHRFLRGRLRTGHRGPPDRLPAHHVLGVQPPETEVTLLRPRAGSPAWGPELLARAQLVRGVEQLTALYAGWERWAADVAESHASYPVLLRFRSPEPHSSWVISQLAVLDAAALHMAACPASAPFEARLCLQMGFTGLRQLARTLRIPVAEDPRPDDPIRLTWEEFLQGWEQITAVGFPVERTAEEAWPHFRGWRVNYEAATYLLASGLDVVPARWSGPRRHGWGPIEPRMPANRTPEHPDGQPVRSPDL